MFQLLPIKTEMLFKLPNLNSNFALTLGLSPGGGLLGILDGGVPPGSPNPDQISDQEMLISTPVFGPGL